MSRMLLGRKIGMTQVFAEDGRRVPVTVVQVEPNVVIGTKSAEAQDGYNAVKIAFEQAVKQEKDGSVRYRGLNKAQVGEFEKAGVAPRRFVREIRLRNADELGNFEVGKELDVSLFAAGDSVDVSGTSKGRGFSGVMKRHNFAGFKASHGVHESYRGGGSIGASADPARVFRGTKMAGRYGGKRITTQNLRVVRVIPEDNIILIRGAVPGAVRGLVEIRGAVKKRR